MNSRADLLDRLDDRLRLASALARSVRRALVCGDALAIGEASERLETVALEFKVMAEEHGRLPAEALDAETRLSRARLESTMTALAREAAIGGGVLERLVGFTRRLIDGMQSARGETYGETGRPRELAPSGVALREEA